MNQENLSVGALQTLIREFVDSREWAPFHTPKNLSMALAGEVGELLEIFQWLTPEESWKVMEDPKRREAIQDEVADILTYTLRLSDLLKIELEPAIRAKLKKSAVKYPADKVRGKATKYTEY